MIYWQLFYEFLKTGLFAVGGGLATLPFLYDMSSRTGWFSGDDLTNMIAVSESTPGPLGINMAAYTGFLAGGLFGAAAAVTGLIFPSVVIIILIARILTKMKDNAWIQAAFCGLKPASFALITMAWLNVLKLTYHPASLLTQEQAAAAPFFWQGLILAAALFLILRKTKAHPILIIILAAAAGIVFRF
ncbi:chromate transporter [Lachnospiraceae bacterium oral taxon 500]|nr:chromate transporter [Lachnospiraceae bacterium oral taxon 500]